MSHFYVSNMKLDETPRFWYLHVDRDVWIGISPRTIELLPSKRRENLLFFPLSLSSFASPLSNFLLSFSFLSWLSFLFPFISFLLWSYLIPSNCLFSICLLPLIIFFHYLIFSSLSFPSFSLFFFSFGLHQPNGPKSGKLPPHFLLRHLSFS